jgi:uncharacterized coiled-coil protein SlyX
VSAPASAPPDDDWRVDLDVKLAYQERLIGDLDALVRAFAERLGKVEKDLADLRRTEAKPADERPPHY